MKILIYDNEGKKIFDSEVISCVASISMSVTDTDKEFIKEETSQLIINGRLPQLMAHTKNINDQVLKIAKEEKLELMEALGKSPCDKCVS